MGCLHMGQLAEAKRLRKLCLRSMERVFPSTMYFGCVTARMIIHAIETDLLGLEAKLIATAVQTAENFKITKFWTQPEKFWDKPPQLP